MILKYLLVAMVGPGLLCSAAASAQSLKDDVQCLALTNVAAQRASSDSERKTTGLASAFYLGRIDGRATGDSLITAMKAQDRKVSGPAAAKALQACAARVETAKARFVATVRQIAQPSK